MLADHVRDAVATAAVFGFFASSWFGWAQETPPRRLRPVLGAGSVLSVLTIVGGVILTIRHWSDGTLFDAGTGPRFGVVVGIEFGLAALGALVLALSAWFSLASAREIG